MAPFAWISIGFVIFLGAASIGVVALPMSFFASVHGKGLSYAWISACLCAAGWVADLIAAPGTNEPHRIYIVAAVLSAPTVLAMAAYAWFAARRQLRGRAPHSPHAGS